MLYRYRRPINGGDLFASIILFLIIVSIIAVLAVYLGAFILFIFLAIGVGIAFIYSIVLYIKAFIRAISNTKNISSKGTISTLLLKSLLLLKESSWLALKFNINIAHSSIIKAHSYKFFSFKKWMWLIVAPSVLILGSILIVILGFAQLSFLIFISLFSLLLFGVIVVLCSLISIFQNAAKTFEIIKNCLIKYNLFCFNYSKATKYKEFLFSVKTFFYNLFLIIKCEIIEELKEAKTSYNNAKLYGLLHIKRYYNYGKILSILVITLLSIIILFVLCIILFIILSITNFVWVTINAIFNH